MPNMASDLTYTDFALALLDDVLGNRHTPTDTPPLTSLGYAPWHGAGVATRGCPRCKKTMYKTEDREGSHWICKSCGHVIPI